ncbi:Unknown protein, partial [Striga hermonthica]
PSSSASAPARSPASGAPQTGRSYTPGPTGNLTPGGSTSTAVGFSSQPGMDGSRTGGGMRCFSCGESGHRQTACPRRAGSHTLVADFDISGHEEAGYDGPPVYDDEPEPAEEHIHGDVGHALILRRSCLSPRASTEDSLQRHNLFESTCTVGGRVCRFIIDTWSCENVVAQDAVE